MFLITRATVVTRVLASALFFFNSTNFQNCAIFSVIERNQLLLLRNQYALRILWPSHVAEKWPSSFFSTALPSVELFSDSVGTFWK